MKIGLNIMISDPYDRNSVIYNYLSGKYKIGPLEKAEFSKVTFKSSNNPKSKRILIVDDETSVLFSLRRLFKTNGYAVHTAGDAMNGLDILRKNPVDIIISDYRMPAMNGDKFLLKTVDISPETPRIILTGLTEIIPKLMANNDQKSVCAYLEKPWSNSELISQANKLIQDSSTPRQGQASTVHLRETAKNLSKIHNRLLNDSGIDEERVKNFKALIDNYKIDSTSTAKKMLDFDEQL